MSSVLLYNIIIAVSCGAVIMLSVIIRIQYYFSLMVCLVSNIFDIFITHIYISVIIIICASTMDNTSSQKQACCGMRKVLKDSNLKIELENLIAFCKI